MNTRLLSILVVTAFALSPGGCTVEQTEEGRGPQVDPGEAPEYEVEPADIDVGWDTVQVRVPDVDITPRDDTVRR
jgi:hypothetical protein